jgi:hypothetical protein|tara:strand:- start:414 stop:653 length:240 start_codon:yes stop_codon:yes gene_type:complete
LKNLIILFSFFLLLSCSDSNKYESLALEKAKEKDCNQEIELLLTHEDTELWASYSKKDSSLLCLFTCVNDACMFSTEKD